MSKTKSADETARERITRDLDTTFLVEAGAGSGKTTKLVDRISVLLSLGKVQIDQIAAVTFTRKAAAELREKLQQRLEQRASDDPDPDVRDRMRLALSDIGQAFIGTIHSFCARMLRERPVESGLDPDFTELEEGEAEFFLQACWQEFLSAAFLRNDETLNKLRAFGIEGKELEDLYLRLCQFRDVEPFAPVSVKPDLAAARKKLDKFMAIVRSAMPSEEPEGGWDGLQIALNRAEWRLARYGRAEDRDLIGVLELFGKGKVTLNRWPDKDTAKNLRDQVWPQFAEDVVENVVREWREYVHNSCVGFARSAAEFAAARRSAESRLDYTDLLIKARNLLRDHEDVRQFLARRFARIFVDEFQDTDPIQCEILFYLAGDRPNSNASWRSFKLRPGAVFVVGDPKQSIYRFRRADIAAYNAVKELVRKSGGEILTLSANYRSVSSIGKFVDGVFESLFPAEATEHQASFVPLATENKDIGSIFGVRKLVVDGAAKKEEIFERSSELVANWVRWALQGHVQIAEKGSLRSARPGDILILTWQRDAVLPHAAALEARQIPFELAGSRGAFGAAEIIDILKLLSSLADPDNSVLLTGVLISSLFGHSYQQLWDYKKLGGAFRFSGAEKMDGPAAAHPIGRSLAKIDSWWRITFDHSPAAAIGIIIERTGIVPLSASSPLGATNAGRLLQLVELVRQAEGFGRADFTSIVEWLNAAVEADIEPLSILAGRQELVRVMNLHRAKGLEAPIVILAAPYKWQSKSPSQHIDRFGEKEPSGYFLTTRKIGEYKTEVLAQPPGWEQKENEEMQYQLAEEQRLLYVAGTRAKQLLIITEAPDSKRAGNAWAGLLKGQVLELPMKGLDTSIQARRKAKIKIATCSQEMKRVEDELTALAKGSYFQGSVTDIAKSPSVLPASGTGMGSKYGSVVHRCLRWIAEGRQPGHRDIELMCKEFELDAKPIDKILEELQKVKQSELWRRAMNAAEHHSETPFSLFVEGKEIGLPPGPILVSGIIDLIFRENDRWCLVDFKTDRIPGDAKPHVDFYSDQLRLYGQAWKKLTGKQVSELLLFFTDPCIAYPVA